MTDSPLRRVLREPALLLGVVTAGMGVLLAFGVHLTDLQTGAIVFFLGAVMAFLRFVLTPSSEVLAQRTPDGPVAGAAAPIATGAPVAVELTPVARVKD